MDAGQIIADLELALEAIRGDFNQLKAKLAQLQQESLELSQQNDYLKQGITELRQENIEVLQENIEFKKQNDYLKATQDEIVNAHSTFADFTNAQVNHLRNLAMTLDRNLRTLREREAQFGPLNTPLGLVNEIQEIRHQLDIVKIELRKADVKTDFLTRLE